jgi:hypothetical protein
LMELLNGNLETSPRKQKHGNKSQVHLYLKTWLTPKNSVEEKKEEPSKLNYESKDLKVCYHVLSRAPKKTRRRRSHRSKEGCCFVRSITDLRLFVCSLSKFQ